MFCYDIKPLVGCDSSSHTDSPLHREPFTPVPLGCVSITSSPQPHIIIFYYNHYSYFIIAAVAEVAAYSTIFSLLPFLKKK
jgi:hypothetical protein